MEFWAESTRDMYIVKAGVMLWKKVSSILAHQDYLKQVLLSQFQYFFFLGIAIISLTSSLFSISEENRFSGKQVFIITAVSAPPYPPTEMTSVFG